jgi:FkbM family methyltransferase
VDPIWLVRNIATAWRRRTDTTNFVRRLAWIYGSKLGLAGRQFTIGFRYPEPIGEIRLCVRANRGADAFIHGEIFEQEHYRLPLNHPPATILDLGANIGLTALYLARRYPRAAIACVEPFAANVQLLSQNLRINHIDAKIFAAAIDAEDGYVTMEIDVNDYGHRIAASNGYGAAGTSDIPAISVPTLMKKMGWDRIGLLKVDIEGHEKVLFSRNCDWLHQVDALCIEWHDEISAGKQQLAAIADRFGFGPPQLHHDLWFISRS